MQASSTTSKDFQESSSAEMSENIQLPFLIAQPKKKFALEESDRSSNVSVKAMTNVASI